MTVDLEVSDLGGGVSRVTHKLPWALDHVHCYVIHEPDGVSVIDAGLGDERTLANWPRALAELGDPVVKRVIITHFHPDHIGASADAGRADGCPEVVQGRLDARLSAEMWVRDAPIEPYVGFFIRNGMPRDLAERSAAADTGEAVLPATPTGSWTTATPRARR